MTIQKRITVGYVWLMVLVVALVGLGVGLVVWLQIWQDEYSTSVADAGAASEVHVNVVDLAANGLAASSLDVGSTESLAGLQGAVQSNLATLTQHLDSVAKNSMGEEIAAIDNMRSLAGQYGQALQDVITLAATDPVQARAKLDENRPLNTQLQEAAVEFKEAQAAEQAVLLQRLDGRSTAMMIAMIVLAFLALAAGIGAAVFISRTIGTQLRAAFGKISTSAAELLAVSSQVAASAAQTAVATNETTATVEEVKQTAQLAHEKAAMVTDTSQSLAKVAETGRKNVQETVTGFERIQKQMTAVTEAINRLGEQAQAVGDIITTVNDLAEQSNLLSVNASIEAAKAGDQGKGFTVVAQEVKSMAEQSKQAVAQVRTVLGEIQKASNMAVQAAEEGSEAIEAGRRQIQESGEGIMALADDAGEAAEGAAQISASSRQQLAGMEQISQAIESINQAGAQSAAGTRQVEQEVKGLQELASTLKRMVDSAATA